MGDAIAICLMEARGFTASDFAKYHPGGALGKKLYVTLGDILQEARPSVAPTSPVKDVIIEISAKRLGAAAVIENGKLLGIITDGDVRRMLERELNFATTTAADIMSVNPKTMDADVLAVEGYHMMESNSITQIIITSQGDYKGIVHLHDILREGIF
jgi:arabinose-5-phosphate isomerase